MLNLAGPTVDLFFVPCSRKVLEALNITSLQFRPYSLRRWCQFQRRTFVYFWRSCHAPRAINLLERQTTGSILFVRFHSRASAFCRSQAWNTFKRREEKTWIYVRKEFLNPTMGSDLLKTDPLDQKKRSDGPAMDQKCERFRTKCREIKSFAHSRKKGWARLTHSSRVD